MIKKIILSSTKCQVKNVNKICFHGQGVVHNAMLFIAVESHQATNCYPVVLDGQFYTAGIFQSIDFHLYRRTSAENYRKHESV